MTCVVQSNGCVFCPAITPVEGQPSRIDYSGVLGWNGGAKSIRRLRGNVLARWSVPLALGAVVGIAREDDASASSNPNRIAHGFFHYATGTVLFAQPVEFGVTVGVGIAHAPSAVIEIIRQGAEIFWRIDDEVVARRVALVQGDTMMQAALYASGDKVS